MMRLENVESKISVYESAFAGGAAGAVTRAIAQPLDVIKIRFQLQIEPIRNGSKYSSILQAISSIIKEEGATALWSGHIPAQLLSITYGTIQFSVFEELSQIVQEADPRFYATHKLFVNFCNGAVAAKIATFVSFPFDTIRTRLIAEQKTEKAYKGFVDACYVMVKNEGPRSLYKGLSPTIAQITPLAGIQFAVYKLFTENVLNRIVFFQRKHGMTVTNESSLLGNLLAGSIAGLVSKTIIYPFDVVKKRLQIQGFQQYRSSFGKQMYCSGSYDCIKLMIINEGFLSLYKGYGPSMLKAMLVSALHFAVYDEIKFFILRLRH